MRRFTQGLALAALALLTAFLFAANAQATLKYKKDTGKKCVFCHTGIPKPGDEDPQLTKDGKEFQRNDHQLTEEQKKKPDPGR